MVSAQLLFSADVFIARTIMKIASLLCLACFIIHMPYATGQNRCSASESLNIDAVQLVAIVFTSVLSWFTCTKWLPKSWVH
jgi:hypothetical protein